MSKEKGNNKRKNLNPRKYKRKGWISGQLLDLMKRYARQSINFNSREGSAGLPSAAPSRSPL